jgi:heme exporter protein A
MFQVQSLACRRGGREVFREVAFALNAGDALIVTGANGSGKSSLLRTLAGLLPVTAGEMNWKGKSVEEDPDSYKQSLRYIGHLDAVKQELTVAEMLGYWRALNDLNHSDSLLAEDPFDVLVHCDKLVHYLSAGQKRRLALTRLVLSDALLWLLDEPTTALDQQGQNILRQCILQHRAKGGIAVIATHQEMDFADGQNYEMKGSSL